MSVVDQVWYYYVLCTYVRTNYGVCQWSVECRCCCSTVGGGRPHPSRQRVRRLSRVGDSVEADADAAMLGASQPLCSSRGPRGRRPFDICVPAPFVINHRHLSHRPPLPATTARFNSLPVNPEY